MKKKKLKATKNMLYYQPLLDKNLIILPESAQVDTYDKATIDGKDAQVLVDAKKYTDDTVVSERADIDINTGHIADNVSAIALNTLKPTNDQVDAKDTAVVQGIDAKLLTYEKTEDVNTKLATKADKDVVQTKIVPKGGISINNVGDDSIEISSTGEQNISVIVYNITLKKGGAFSKQNDAFKGCQVDVTILEDTAGAGIFNICTIGSSNNPNAEFHAWVVNDDTVHIDKLVSPVGEEDTEFNVKIVCEILKYQEGE